MKSIGISFPDDFGFWLEVEKFLRSNGFANRRDAFPQSALMISESVPFESVKSNSILIFNHFHEMPVLPGLPDPGNTVFFISLHPYFRWLYILISACMEILIPVNPFKDRRFRKLTLPIKLPDSILFEK